MSVNNSLRFEGVGNLIEREYRNLPGYQWARELAKNGIEHGATNIEFGPEWKGVKATDTYRMMYADNGTGMSKDELRTYMRTLGEGGKHVGGPHDNYAMGSRMSLLPWNPAGVVVISLKDGQTSMVKLIFDQEANEGAGEYALESVIAQNELGEVESESTVYEPYQDEDLGFHWDDTLPEFIRASGHGTVFILLGRSLDEDTIMGDISKSENQRHLGRKYFNNRFWTFPDGVKLTVFEMPQSREKWPKFRSDATNHKQNRTIRGARHYTEYVNKEGIEFVKSSGSVELPDKSRVHWWLRTQPRIETGGVGSSSGFISVLYRDELYATAFSDKEDGESKSGASVYRQFGISSDSMRRRLTFVIEPPEYDEERGIAGVAPSTGRADLYWMGTGTSARSIKPGDWAEEFNRLMPQEIIDAVSEESLTADGDEDRHDRLKKIADRFTKRWRIKKARVAEVGGDTTTDPTQLGAMPRTPLDAPTPTQRKARSQKKIIVRPRNGNRDLGAPDVPGISAKSTTVSGGVPDFQWVKPEDINEEGMFATWIPAGQMYPNGCVNLDETYPVLQEQISYWQSQYPATLGKAVESKVKNAYSEVAVAKISHIHALTGPLFSEEQRNAMLENHVLTASLLGLISEDSYISPQLGALGAKRTKDDESESSEQL